MSQISLSNDHIAISIAPEFGARVTELVDRRSGRNWLVGGACEGDTGEAAAYLGTEARGWDECAPTVAPCEDPDWGRRLRDHGDLWGRPWKAERARGNVTNRFEGPEFTFTRGLRLDGPCLLCDYTITATTHARLPWMWSQHLLLATHPGERIVLDGVGQWEDHGTVPETMQVQDLTSGLAQKTYGTVQDQACIGIDGTDGGIRLRWSAAQMPYCGVWLGFGGWPTPEAPLHQMALEPTTAPADDLAVARASGTERWLEPGQTEHWQVEIAILPRTPE
ncbi:galactose mutarotase-like enzyme [Aliiruegeria haliotis]|uniref:Galactose mutarotase-like enzyme n=1 Tax=Aliiruegeria haliotis TaxID=1280846 RepID=A0A2T0RVY6_9RHOB|nr:hypothetical protein [Aliiruegeria haliotis]PRY25356.1 galactose mutarotase-like enzyme [Aliiruegeria haliotis]